MHTVAAPHPYRGEHADDPAAYARDAVAEVERLAAAGTPVGAFVAESIFGNAGGVFLPDDAEWTLTSLPTYITLSERGAGFAEVARALLQAKSDAPEAG